MQNFCRIHETKCYLHPFKKKEKSTCSTYSVSAPADSDKHNWVSGMASGKLQYIHVSNGINQVLKPLSTKRPV